QLISAELELGVGVLVIRVLDSSPLKRAIGDFTVDLRLLKVGVNLDPIVTAARLVVVVAIRILVVLGHIILEDLVAHQRGATVSELKELGSILLLKSATQVDAQAPDALLTSTEAEGEVSTIALDINGLSSQVDLVLDRELAAELRSCRNVRGEAQREDGSQGQSRKALHPCVSPSVSRVSRPSRWHPKGSPASGQCFLADRCPLAMPGLSQRGTQQVLSGSTPPSHLARSP